MHLLICRGTIVEYQVSRFGPRFATCSSCSSSFAQQVQHFRHQFPTNSLRSNEMEVALFLFLFRFLFLSSYDKRISFVKMDVNLLELVQPSTGWFTFDGRT